MELRTKQLDYVENFVLNVCDTFITNVSTL